MSLLPANSPQETIMKGIPVLLVLLLTLGVFALLTGCGGGGSSAVNTGRISGFVQNQTAAGMTRASVDDIVVGIDGTSISTRVESDGSFVLDRVPAGLHTLYAMTADGQRALVVVAEVSPGHETHVGEMLLQGAGWISGLVTSASDHRPISGARVTATDQVTANPADEQPHAIRMTITDVDGTYALRGLPEGLYTITIEKPGYAPVTLSLTVAAGRTTTGDAALQSQPAPPGGIG
jgi:hypothetical protein